MTVSVGTIRSMIMIISHCSRKGKRILASAVSGKAVYHDTQHDQDRRIEKGIPHIPQEAVSVIRKYNCQRNCRLEAGGINAAMVFMSAVIAASGLKELANIQITGNRKKMESTSSTATRIQLIRLCFFVNMLFFPPSLSFVSIFWMIVRTTTNIVNTMAIVDARPISQLTVPRLVNIIYQRVSRMIRSAACHDHRLYQHPERADGNCDEHNTHSGFNSGRVISLNFCQAVA